MMSKKAFFLLALVIFFCISMQAQVLYDNISSTAISLRDPARQSSTDIDAIIFNPAGLTSLDVGLTLSISGIYSHFSVNDKVSVFFDNYIRDYHNTVNTLNPSAQLAYNWGKWAIGASMAREGGYNNWYCAQGSPAIDKFDYLFSQNSNLDLIDLIIGINGILLDHNNTPENRYLKSYYGSSSLNSSFSQFNYRLSASYKRNITRRKRISLSFGLNIQHTSYRKKFDRNIMLMDLDNMNSMSYLDYQKDIFNTINTSWSENKQSQLDIIQTEYEMIVDYENRMKELSSCDSYKSIWSLSPVLGINYSVDSIKNIQNIIVATNFTPGYLLAFGGLQKTTSFFDIPSELSLGASISFCKYYMLSLGTSLYSSFLWPEGYNSNIDLVQENWRFSTATSASFTYLIPNSIVHLSCGFQYSYNSLIMNYGAAFLEHKVNAFSGNLGCSVDALQNLQLNVGFAVQGFDNFKQNPAYSSFETSLLPRYIFSIGFTYKY